MDEAEVPDQAEGDVQEPSPPARREKPKLVVQQVLPGSIGYIVPRSIEEAHRMAAAIIAAGLAPDSYKERGAPSVEKVMVGLMKSLEVGFPPLTGLSTIAIIGNRPCIWGDGATALVQRSGLLKSLTKRVIGTCPLPDTGLQAWPDSYGYEVTAFRVGQDEPYVGSFTVADAKRADLWLNDRRRPWVEYPDRMLFNRARAFALRDGFADALMGLSIREEVEDANPDVRQRETVDVSSLTGETIEAVASDREIVEQDEY